MSFLVRHLTNFGSKEVTGSSLFGSFLAKKKLEKWFSVNRSKQLKSEKLLVFWLALKKNTKERLPLCVSLRDAERGRERRGRRGREEESVERVRKVWRGEHGRAGRGERESV